MDTAGSREQEWGRNVAKFVTAAALVFCLLYGSDLLLLARADLFMAPAKASGDYASAPWRTWAYVPIGGPTRGETVAAEQGEAVFESHPSAPNLANNDLYRRVLEARKRLRINLAAREDNGVSAARLRALMPWLGGEMEWAGAGKATVFAEDRIVVFEPGKKHAERNYNRIELPRAPYVLNDDLYIPLASVATAYGMKLTHHAAIGLITLSKGDLELRALMDNKAFRIVVDRSDRWVRIHYAGQMIRHYRACVGEGNNTPLGEFYIESKAVWPGWRAYWGEYIPGGTSRNPLGARFLRTSARGRVTGWGIGIHGTNQPSSIGRRISGGCIRLLNKHIIEVYEVIPVGTRVRFQE